MISQMTYSNDPSSDEASGYPYPHSTVTTLGKYGPKVDVGTLKDTIKTAAHKGGTKSWKPDLTHSHLHVGKSGFYLELSGAVCKIRPRLIHQLIHHTGMVPRALDLARRSFASATRSSLSWGSNPKMIATVRKATSARTSRSQRRG